MLLKALKLIKKKKLTHVDVVLELCGDRDDGCLLCASSLDERLDLVVVVTSRRLADDVDLEIYKFYNLLISWTLIITDVTQRLLFRMKLYY